MYKSILLFFMILSCQSILFAQSEVDNMLKDITGKVDEIVIKSGGKEYTYSGDEAEKLFSALKESKKTRHFEFITRDGNVLLADSLRKKIIIKKGDKDLADDLVVFLDKDDLDMEEGEENIEKQIIVTADGDQKIVKVIIDENGKENIEVYEGDAAKEYLDKLNSEETIEINIDKDNKIKKTKKIIINKKIETE